MAAEVTLAHMLEELRDLADMPTGLAEQWSDESADMRFGSTRKAVRALNRAIKRLYGKLQIARGEGRYTTVHPNISLVADQSRYDLPDDFAELESAVHYDGSSCYSPMDAWQPRELGMLLSSASEYLLSRAPYQYRLLPKKIEILPTPTISTEAVLLRYVPTCHDLVTPLDSFDGVNGWESWAIYSAAMELRGMAEADTSSAIVQNWVEIDGQIEALAPARNAADPAQVQDHEGWR